MITIINRQDSIVNKYLAELRDVNVQKDRLRFRHNIQRIGQLMAYEVSKTLHYAPTDVQTPLAKAEVRLSDDQIVVGTIMRAGLPMHQGVLDVFDDAENCFVSAFRVYNADHTDVEIRLGYSATPRLDGKVLVLADPMLATGYSMMQTIEQLLQFGRPAHIHILSVIGAQAGVDYVSAHLPEGIPTSLWVAAVDPVLNADKYIVPGLGDAGDLCFGEKL